MDICGIVRVEKCCGRSTATRLFSGYPLKIMLPSKVASSDVDALWMYLITYGGGIVSGDTILCRLDIGEDCTLALTTQASTKIYKAVENKWSEQVLEVNVAKKALLVVIPDPVTCFASAKYRQLQTFSLEAGANLVLVDWLTSGRRERGEVWCFDSYKSANRVYMDGKAVFLDTISLEGNGNQTVYNRLERFHSVAMLLVCGPRLVKLRKQIQEAVECVSKEAVKRRKLSLLNPGLICSCSSYGSKDTGGLIVRILADDTEVVYHFLRTRLAGLSQFIGAPPYSGK